MDSFLKQRINTDVPQNSLDEDHLSKLLTEKKKNEEKLQELNAKLGAKEIELGSLQEKIKAKNKKLFELMDHRDRYGLESDCEE